MPGILYSVPVKVVLVSDIHSRTNRIRDLEPQLRDAGLVLLLGDLTHFGHADEAAAVLGKFEGMHPHVLTVSGNRDYPDVERFLAGRGMSLGGRCLSLDGRCFIGKGWFATVDLGRIPLSAALRRLS